MTKTKEMLNTAYHEAGHAVAAFVLHIPIGRDGATIIPDHNAGSLGTCHILRKLKENPTYATSPRTRARIEDLSVMLMAGDAAQRRFQPRSRYGGHRDIQDAIDLLDYVSSSSEVSNARVRVAFLEARALVECHWDRIRAVATSLYDKRTLSREDVLCLIRGVGTAQ